MCQARILRLARDSVGAGVAGDEVISFDFDLLAGLLLRASSLAMPAPTGLCEAWILRLTRNPVGAGVAGDEAISFDFDLLAGLLLRASSLAMPAPTGFV